MPAGGYRELRLEAPEAIAEPLTNFLWELGALGVVEEERPGALPEIRAFFPGDGPASEELCARARAYLEGLQVLGFPSAGAPRVSPLTEAPWQDAWRLHFQPQPVGRTLLVAPPWERPEPGGRLTLTLEPGRAFGTGQHGSTAGCLEALEALLARAPADRVIDLGTGSGILAVAAARLGVPRVLAIDTDPDAVAACAANAALNGLDGAVQARLDDVATLEAPAAPLVLANLLATAHLAFAARYRRLTAPGGALVLGGLLDGEAEEVTAALAVAGFTPEAARSRDGWTTLTFRAESAPAPLHDRA
jgi:ribosomal protein L11 methyltransferase